MKIWLIKDGEPIPTDEQNGRLLRTGSLAKVLVQRGHQVTWITSTWDHQKKCFRAKQDMTLEVAYNYHLELLHAVGYQRNISLQRIKHYRQLANKMTAYMQQQDLPDVIVVAFPAIELAEAAVKFAKQHGIPILVDLRDMWPDIITDVAPKLLRPIAKLFLHSMYRATRYALREATGLIGITDAFLSWGLAYAQRERGVNDRVFPLAYSEEKFTPTELAEAKQFWLQYQLEDKQDELLISFVGSLNDSLPLDEAIQAVKTAETPVRLVIAGLGSNLQRYQRLAAGCEKIIFPGWLNKPKIHYLLTQSNIGLAPYIQRKDFAASIPNKVVEYLAHSLPVYTTLQGVTKDLIETNQCGVVYQSGQLITVLKQTSQQSLLAMSAAAESVFAEHFAASKVYLDYCQTIETLVGKEHSNE